MKNLILSICVLLMVTSCNNRHFLSPDSFVNWVENEDNGLHAHTVVGKIRYDLQYKPIEYINLIENRDSADHSSVVEREKQLEGLQYYQLRISIDESNADVMTNISSGDQDLLQRLSYLQFEFRNRIKLIQDGDTLPCSLYHFQNYQGMAPFVDFVFAFQSNVKDKNIDRTLLIDDTVFGAGPIHFEFLSAVFQATPQINY